MRFSPKHCLAIVAIAISIDLPNTAQAGSILVDDFGLDQDVGLIGIPNFIPSSSQEGPAGTGILGGFRDAQAMGDASNFLETRLQVTGGQLSFSNNVGTNGSGMIVWDGDDNPTTIDDTGLGGLDITNEGGMILDRIDVDIVSSDLPGLELGFDIYDVNGNVSSLTQTFNSIILNASTESFLFTNFAGSADFTNIGAIKLTINAPPEIDVTLSQIQITGTATVIPAPAAAGTSLLGLVCLIARRRRV